MGSAAAKVLGIHAFLAEQGFAKEQPVVYGDSSSALQLVTRTGAGRLKHMRVRLLAIQSRVAAERLHLMTVKSAEKGADVLTKHVSRETWEKLCARQNQRGIACPSRALACETCKNRIARGGVSLILVVHTCASVISSRVIIAHIMWMRRRLETQVILTKSHHLDSFLDSFAFTTLAELNNQLAVSHLTEILLLVVHVPGKILPALTWR